MPIIFPRKPFFLWVTFRLLSSPRSRSPHPNFRVTLRARQRQHTTLPTRPALPAHHFSEVNTHARKFDSTARRGYR